MNIQPLFHKHIVHKSTDKTLVFLHGFCENHSMWESLISKGFDDYNLLLIDLPGFGESNISNETSIEEMGELIISLLDILNISKAIFFGHSMGGYVAASILNTFKERVLGVGLINSHLYSDTQQTIERRSKSIEFIENNGKSLYVKQLIPSLFPSSFRNLNTHLMTKLIHLANNGPEFGIINALKAMMTRSDLSGRFYDNTSPMLFIIGELDNIIPQEKFILQTLDTGFCQLAFLKNSGHMSPFEKEGVVRNEILGFLKYIDTL